MYPFYQNTREGTKGSGSFALCIKKISCATLLATYVALQSPSYAEERTPKKSITSETVLAKDYKESSKITLFNGIDLTGWSSVGQGKWEVIDGVIRGEKSTTDRGWGHLVSDQEFGDGLVRLRYKLVKGNSGAYIHGVVGGRFQVYGMQIDLGSNRDGKPMAVTPNRYHWLNVPQKHVDSGKFGEWNFLEVEVIGRRLRVWVNGKRRFDTLVKKEDMPNLGKLAFQLHAGHKANEFYFKDIELYPLEKENLIKNGSFELSSKGDFWVPETGPFERHHTSVLKVKCKDAKHYAELASTVGYNLTQTVKVDKTKKYQLKFYAQARPRANRKESLFVLRVNGKKVREILPEFGKWSEYTYEIQPDTDKIKISFEDQHFGHAGIGAMVDMVSITAK